MATKLYPETSPTGILSLTGPGDGGSLKLMSTFTTVLGPTTVEYQSVTWGNGADNDYPWTSVALSAVTISGLVTFNWWCREVNMTDNAGFKAELYRLVGASTETLIVSATSAEITSGTSNAVLNWSATPGAGVALAAGDKLRLRLFVTDAGGTMAAGSQVNGAYNGSTAASNGDVWVQVTETVTAQGGGAADPTHPYQGSGGYIGTFKKWVQGWSRRQSGLLIPQGMAVPA